MRYLVCLILALSLFTQTRAQGYFSGDLQLNTDFYIRDSVIGAFGTPHYDNLLAGTDSWLQLNYNNYDFQLDLGVRLDLFNNSNLHQPGIPFSGVGVGRWYISKGFNKLRITGGYFYDQFGSGIIFRAFEDRALGIDNAILGVHLEYDVIPQLKIKAFTGVQKNRFLLYKPIIKGVNFDGFFSIGEKLTLAPGIAAVNRTMDQESMSIVVDNIESYPVEERFVPRYNVYFFSGYNTLSIGGFSWYFEGAGKTHEAIADLDGQLYDRKGYVIFTNMTYSVKGLGITLHYKKTKDFTFRTSPNEFLLTGMINYIPPISRQNSLRLPARYNAATQEIDEEGFGLDFTYSPSKGYTINVNYSEINTEASKEMGDTDIPIGQVHPKFRELYVDFEIKKSKKIKAMGGFQYVRYDQVFYEGKGEADLNTYTPFAEIEYKIDKKKSLRFEVQYQSARDDFGQWAYALLEFNIAPHFSFSVSDMWNFDPNIKRTGTEEKVHYYNVFGAYTIGPHRFSLSYVKQVEGIVCTGGVCRFEPAFSGVRFSVISTF